MVVFKPTLSQCSRQLSGNSFANNLVGYTDTISILLTSTADLHDDKRIARALYCSCQLERDLADRALATLHTQKGDGARRSAIDSVCTPRISKPDSFHRVHRQRTCEMVGLG